MPDSIADLAKAPETCDYCLKALGKDELAWGFHVRCWDSLLQDREWAEDFKRADAERAYGRESDDSSH